MTWLLIKEPDTKKYIVNDSTYTKFKIKKKQIHGKRLEYWLTLKRLSSRRGHKEDYWSARNVLHLEMGGGYMYIHM